MKKHAQQKNNKWILIGLILAAFVIVGGFVLVPMLNKAPRDDIPVVSNIESQLDGTIKAIDEVTFTVVTDKQKTYIFNKTNVTFIGDPLEVDGKIHLVYKGSLTENSSTPQSVELVSAEIKLSLLELVGTIKEYSPETITVTKDDKIYTFKYTLENIKSGTIQTDNPIHIGYLGTLKDSQDIQEARLVKMDITEIDRTFNGTITGVNEQAIAIKDDDGREYLFKRDNVGGDNVIVGYKAAVTYKGKIDETNGGVQTLAISLIQITKVDLGPSDPILALMDKMSMDEKIGQMFMVRCPPDAQVSFVQNYKIGGYILFARDFENKSAQEVIDNVKSYQNASSIPLLIGTDEEGGTVARVSRYFRDSIFQSPQELYAQGGMDAILNDVDDKSGFLKYFGINVNFAPVADVTTNPNDFIYDRSFGKSAQENADFVGQVVWRMKQDKMGSVLKHFPGYGNNGDTHTNICYDERSMDTFKNNDFLPFIAGIKNGAECILVNHNIVVAMDSERPASLSRNVHDILRNDLGYDKVIVTDDLAMDGVADYTDSNNIAVMAILAGNDILLTSDAPTQIEAVKEAVANGTINVDQINASVERILRWKHNLGLI